MNVCHMNINGASHNDQVSEYSLMEKNESPVETIKSWMENNAQEYFRCDDSFILQQLRFTDYDIEKTKRRITCYENIRLRVPFWFTNLDETGAQIIIIQNKTLCVVNYQESTDKAIAILRIGNADLHLYNMDFHANISRIVIESYLEDPHHQEFGAEMILDFKNISFHTLTLITVKLISTICEFYQSALPVKVHRFHLINAPIILTPFVAAGTWLANRVSTDNDNIVINHGSNINSLLAVISHQCLPFEYGGTAGPLEQFTAETFEAMKKRKSEIITQTKYSKRV